MKVYLDNAATTRLDERVLDAMMPFLRESYGNASSPHGLGRKARFAVEDARERVAEHLGAEPGEIVFTSGGTEANNLAIWGAARAVGRRMVTSSAEHESVLEPARDLESQSGDVTFIDPAKEGAVTVAQVEPLIASAGGFVSFMHTNNETGAVNPVRDLADVCRDRGWLIHTDAVQALGWAKLDVDHLGVDLMSISAHKIYGPKGVGVLYARADTIDLEPLVRGGSQERRRRGGTENVAGIVGLATALNLVAERRVEYRRRLETLRTRLINQLSPLFDEGAILNSPQAGAPHLINISFPPSNGTAVDGEMLLLNLDVAGVGVSSGSACTSGAVEPSHVLLAMGRDRETAAATVRFSLGRDNSPEDVDYAAEQLIGIVKRMRGKVEGPAAAKPG